MEPVFQRVLFFLQCRRRAITMTQYIPMRPPLKVFVSVTWGRWKANRQRIKWRSPAQTFSFLAMESMRGALNLLCEIIYWSSLFQVLVGFLLSMSWRPCWHMLCWHTTSRWQIYPRTHVLGSISSLIWMQRCGSGSVESKIKGRWSWRSQWQYARTTFFGR